MVPWMRLESVAWKMGVTCPVTSTRIGTWAVLISTTAPWIVVCGAADTTGEAGSSFDPHPANNSTAMSNRFTGLVPVWTVFRRSVRSVACDSRMFIGRSKRLRAHRTPRPPRYETGNRRRGRANGITALSVRGLQLPARDPRNCRRIGLPFPAGLPISRASLPPDAADIRPSPAVRRDGGPVSPHSAPDRRWGFADRPRLDTDAPGNT